MAAKAKINTARDLFYFSDDIMRITGFSQSKSYKIMGLDVDTRQKSRA